ncbi:glycine betaine/L-proline ABC transporter ATP-binding protein [Devosia sp. MC521]|uniref:quaternary amine ABC transporter ATP-binding protein n=1 Tax=Devosia sp. MC521 TaxID=2759954 RepID=UPI0015F988F1|nr:glycine betaine/L-proline ABC transporter ATP-binding protein [Devosia sp. MC521]MBJ6988979.1 glycine betaine/L-proline ABC transporter ATP-binding protein [Devosia sp. MC521]QMW61135.1 glycine betaine/L-proline ABC transporter ATP-binding protein [Devosia sp. MC521]
MNIKLRVEKVFKIFGSRPNEALNLLKRGESKEAIFQATGQTIGVQDASFDVLEGQIFVIMGLSGSGKSTMVRMLNGLIRPTSGKILIDGDDVASCSAAKLRDIRRNKITMVFQHFALFPHRTILENAAFGLKVKGVPQSERQAQAMAALEQVGLASWANSKPADLSGGMQQRVGLARGLATNPEILLMDEPFGALDPLIRREMQDELLALQSALKKTIIFITHDLNEALLLGDKIAIMKDGRVVQIGTAQDIVSNPADDYVAAFVADIDRGRVFTAETVASVPSVMQLDTDTAGDAVRRMEDENLNAVYVMDGEDLAGLVTYQQAAVADRDSGDDDVKLADVMVTDYPTTDRDTQLSALYGAASAGLPIAITDDDNRLLGVVEPEAVFAQISADQVEAETPEAAQAEAQMGTQEGGAR